MKEKDYILIQRLTNIRAARKLLSDCEIERHSKFQEALRILYEEIEFLENKVEVEE